MSPPLVALLLVLLVPLFVGKWRTSLLGLSCQGLLTAWIAVRLHPDLANVEAWIGLADLVILRGILAPWLLASEMRRQAAPPRSDVIPPNMLSWALALGSVLVAFHFAEALVREPGEEQALVAVATVGLLLGFLVLATQPKPFSQMVGTLRIENAIALFEVGGGSQHREIGVHIGQLVIVLTTIVLYRWYLATLEAADAPQADATVEGGGL